LEEPRTVRLLSRMNPLILGILRSPLHWILSPGLMQVEITGRRTGRAYAIPVGYYRTGDVVLVMVSDAPSRSWWRNFLEPAKASLLIKGRRLEALGRVPEPGSPEFVMRAEQNFRRAGFIARLFGIGFDPAVGLRPVQQEALARYARVVVFELVGQQAER